VVQTGVGAEPRLGLLMARRQMVKRQLQYSKVPTYSNCDSPALRTLQGIEAVHMIRDGTS
jgi:hypothetical protein